MPFNEDKIQEHLDYLVKRDEQVVKGKNDGEQKSELDVSHKLFMIVTDQKEADEHNHKMQSIERKDGNTYKPSEPTDDQDSIDIPASSNRELIK